MIFPVLAVSAAGSCLLFTSDTGVGRYEDGQIAIRELVVGDEGDGGEGFHVDQSQIGEFELADDGEA